MIAALSAPDALAITMVAVLAFALGSVATLFVIMDRNAKRSQDQLDLPEEMEKETAPASPNAESEAPKEDWEQDADWWKS